LIRYIQDLNLLLEQDGAESGVEGCGTLVLQHLAEATDQAVGISGLRHETDTGGLQRAKRNVGEELCERGGGQVHGSAVVAGGLVPEDVDRLLLEQFISSELERALEEVSGSGGTETGQQRTSTLIGDDLAETPNETLVVCDGIELYSGLDAVIAGPVSKLSSGALPIPTSSAANHRRKTYTSTGVRPPWVTEQHTAPARANLE
jgi:hypothetical protein